MALFKLFSLKLLYYHYFIRKPVNWFILIFFLTLASYVYFKTEVFPFYLIAPLIISCLGLILAYRVHQEVIFKELDFPELTSDFESLPLTNDMKLALIDYNGIFKAYPLDYVIHHHIINDYFGDKLALDRRVQNR